MKMRGSFQQETSPFCVMESEFVAMIELDIEQASMEERTVKWKGQTMVVDRALMNPAKDMVIFMGNTEGRRKAMRVNIAVSDTQAIIMGDLSPLFVNPL
jgi:hypothetical protein